MVSELFNLYVTLTQINVESADSLSPLQKSLNVLTCAGRCYRPMLPVVIWFFLNSFWKSKKDSPHVLLLTHKCVWTSSMNFRFCCPSPTPSCPVFKVSSDRHSPWTHHHCPPAFPCLLRHLKDPVGALMKSHRPGEFEASLKEWQQWTTGGQEASLLPSIPWEFPPLPKPFTDGKIHSHGNVHCTEPFTHTIHPY